MYISCVIPTYNEGNYLFDTLSRLTQQTTINQCEIILSDFDPQGTKSTYSVATKFLSAYPQMVGKVKIVDIPRKGIGFARQRGCDLSSQSAPIICNMDADCYYSTNDGMEQMVRPIVNGAAVMTACDNMVDDGMFAGIIANPGMGLYNAAQAIAPFLTRYEPGSCILKRALYEAGGFADTKQSELIPVVRYLAINNPLSIANVSSTIIVKSARRTKSIMDPNNLGKTGNYDYAFR